MGADSERDGDGGGGDDGNGERGIVGERVAIYTIYKFGKAVEGHSGVKGGTTICLRALIAARAALATN